MSLKVGIIGMPNTGKTTIFNAMTGLDAPVSVSPFTTIEPNIGTVNVPDERMNKLVSIYNPKKIVWASCEFVDIAGLGVGASKGEGMGNEFLVNVRESDALIHVVRCFASDEVYREEPLSPAKDIENLNMELIFSDIDMIEKRIPKIEKKALMKVDKESPIEYALLLKLKEHLLTMSPLREMELSKEEKKMISSFAFLTSKPILYVLNIDEKDINGSNPMVKEAEELIESLGATYTEICGSIEYEISRLDEEDKKVFLEDLGLEQPSLNKVIKQAYDLLGLETVFTCGDKDCHAWTYKKGMKAPQVAGCIHSDFERGFIRAEVVGYNDLITAGSEQKAKELNMFRLEGKEYVVNDGDIVHFRFNI